jgi:hypothetical protein
MMSNQHVSYLIPIYKIQIVGMFVCLLVAAELKTNLHQIWHDHSFRQGRYFRKVRTPKIVPNLSPNERDSCNLETKFNR